MSSRNGGPLLLPQACGVQAISGTGSLRLGAEFLFKHYCNKTVYVSKPTWGECVCVCVCNWYCECMCVREVVIRIEETYILLLCAEGIPYVHVMSVKKQFLGLCVLCMCRTIRSICLCVLHSQYFIVLCCHYRGIDTKHVFLQLALSKLSLSLSSLVVVTISLNDQECHDVTMNVHEHCHTHTHTHTHTHIHPPPHTANHRGILTEAGFTDIREYRYYKQETRGLDYEGMIEDLRVSRRCLRWYIPKTDYTCKFCKYGRCDPVSTSRINHSSTPFVQARGV